MLPMSHYAPKTVTPARVITLRGLHSGLWELSDSQGRMGGLFLDLKSGLRFARLECGEAIVLVDSRPAADH